MLIGLGLAALCAVVTNAGFLLKQRGAAAAADVDMRYPLRSARDLFRSRWWTIGWFVAFVAFALHAAALAQAPLSIVQAVVAGGLVFLALLAERWFGFQLGRREWLGIVMAAVGLGLLGVTQQAGVADPSSYSLAALIAFECGLFGLAGLVIAATIKVQSWRPLEGELLGLAAGGLFGVSDVAVKYLSDQVLDDVTTLVSPWTGAALAASVVAFYASARSLQIGPAIKVIALTSVGANIAAIVGGVLVFHDSLGPGVLGLIARVTAFLLVVGGAALIPGPMRVAGDTYPPGKTIKASTA